MERLWTPWRMSYVSGSAAGTTSHAPSAGGADQPAARAAPESDTAGQAPLAAPGCFLCATAAAPAAHDAENLVLHRAELGFVVLNLYPYNTGHVMIAPYAHVGDLALLPPPVGHALFDLTRRAVAALQDEYRPDGFNVGLNLGRAAGAGLPDHLHVHVVPRWSGDTNFMPVLGQTKVLPEALAQTWARLRPHLT